MGVLCSERDLWILHQIAKRNGRFAEFPPEASPDEVLSYRLFWINEGNNRFPGYPADWVNQPLRVEPMTLKERKRLFARYRCS